MIKRNTAILFVIFAVLLAGTLFWQRSKMSEQATPTPFKSSISYVFSDVTSTDIKSLRMSGPDNAYLELERRDDGQWVFIQPKLGLADNAEVDSALSQLAFLPLTSNPDLAIDLPGLGLQPPIYTIFFTMKDGRNYSLNVGKATPTGSGYYILSSQRAVAVASKLGLDNILELLKTPPVQPTPTATATETPAVTPTAESALPQTPTP